MEHLFSYNYFFDLIDGNPMFFEERIREAVALLQEEGDYILLEEDGTRCANEQELREALEERRNQ